MLLCVSCDGSRGTPELEREAVALQQRERESTAGQRGKTENRKEEDELGRREEKTEKRKERGRIREDFQEEEKNESKRGLDWKNRKNMSAFNT